MIISAGVILGFLLGGRVTDSLGSLYVFLLGSLLSALGFFYGLARVNNIVPQAKKSENLEEEGHWWQRVLSHMRRTLGLPFRKREPGARPLVLLLCLAFLLGVSAEYGIEYTEYAFTFRSLLGFGKTSSWCCGQHMYSTGGQIPCLTSRSAIEDEST